MPAQNTDGLAYITDVLDGAGRDPQRAATTLLDLAETLVEARVDRNAFRAEVRDWWGEALDGLDMLVSIAEDVGRAWDGRFGPTVFKEPEYRSRALNQVWGGAMSVGYEVLNLLESGHGGGGLARWRTLHELHVVAHVLAWGDNETADSYMTREGLRFQQGIVDWHRAWKADDRIEQLDRDLVLSARDALKRLTEDHGPEFRGDFGWAHRQVYESDPNYRKRFDQATRPNGPSWSDLQRLVGLQVFAPLYDWASRNVHASPVVGTVYLPVELQGSRIGPSLHGLMPAGNGTAQVIGDVTAFVIRSYPIPEDPRFARAAEVLLALGDEVALLFRIADSALRTADGYTVGEVRRTPARSMDTESAESRDRKVQDEAELLRALVEALRASTDLADLLVREAGGQLPVGSLSCEIGTRTVPDEEPERFAQETEVLEITVTDGHSPLYRLWAECRLEAIERRSRLPALCARLQSTEPPASESRLLAVVDGFPEREFVPLARHRSMPLSIRVLSWFDVKDLVIQAGRCAGGPDWLEASMSTGDAPHADALRGFVESLERLGSIFRARALDPKSLESIEIGDAPAIDHLAWLLWRACFTDSVPAFGRPVLPLQFYEHSTDALLFTLTLEPTCESWLLDPDIDGTLSVAVALWEEEGLMVHAGSSIRAHRIAVTDAERETWEDRVEQDGGFEVIPFPADDDADDEELFIVRSIALGEIAAAGPTIRDQERALANFVAGALEVLMDAAMSPTNAQP